MSLEAMTWAMTTKPRTATEKLVLLSLADHHNRSTGRCDPSMTTIADEALCSKRQAIRCIESLQDQGFIEGQKVNGARTRYTLRMTRTGDTHVTGDTDDTGDTHVTPTGDTHVTGPVTPMSPEPGSNQEINQEGGAFALEATEPTKRKRAARKTPVPDDFPITDRMRGYFAEKRVPGSIEDVTDHFLTHHRAKGTTHADWYAAWQLWCRNQIKFAADRSGAQTQGPRRREF